MRAYNIRKDPDPLYPKITFDENQDIGIVPLLGGGEDSAMMLWMFIEQAFAMQDWFGKLNVHPVYWNYRQSTYAPELQAVRQQLDKLDNFYRVSNHHDRMIIHPITILEDPIAEYVQVGADHSVEYRNLRFVVNTAALATTMQAKFVGIGMVPGAMQDGSQIAYTSMDMALHYCVQDPEKRVELYAPFVTYHKQYVAYLMGTEDCPFDPLQDTFSCYSPNQVSGASTILYKSCGKCPSCQARMQAHRFAGDQEWDLLPFIRVPSATKLKKGKRKVSADV